MMDTKDVDEGPFDVVQESLKTKDQEDIDATTTNAILAFSDDESISTGQRQETKQTVVGRTGNFIPNEYIGVHYQSFDLGEDTSANDEEEDSFTIPKDCNETCEAFNACLTNILTKRPKVSLETTFSSFEAESSSDSSFSSSFEEQDDSSDEEELSKLANIAKNFQKGKEQASSIPGGIESDLHSLLDRTLIPLFEKPIRLRYK